MLKQLHRSDDVPTNGCRPGKLNDWLEEEAIAQVIEFFDKPKLKLNWSGMAIESGSRIDNETSSRVKQLLSIASPTILELNSVGSCYLYNTAYSTIIPHKCR